MASIPKSRNSAAPQRYSGIDPYDVPDAVAAAMISFWERVDPSIREDALASASSEESLAG